MTETPPRQTHKGKCHKDLRVAGLLQLCPCLKYWGFSTTGIRVIPMTTASGPASRVQGVMIPWLTWWRGLAESSSPLITATGPGRRQRDDQLFSPTCIWYCWSNACGVPLLIRLLKEINFVLNTVQNELHQSAETFQPLAAEMKNIDHLTTVQYPAGKSIQTSLQIKHSPHCSHTHTLMKLFPPGRQHELPHHKNCSQTARVTESLKCWPGHKVPHIQIWLNIHGMCLKSYDP